MNHPYKQTRMQKFDKRRKNTRSISILIMIAVLLILLLIVIWLFDGKDAETTEENHDLSSNQSAETQNDDPGLNHASEDEATNKRAQDDENAQNNINSENTHPSDEQVIDEDEAENDPSNVNEEDNVLDSYTDDWPVIPTQLETPDYYNFSEASQNRQEIEQAVKMATQLSDDMIVWWLANGGPGKVEATVASRDESEIYRVYIQWQDNQGWQPILVEQLKENDQKWRFENNENDNE